MTRRQPGKCNRTDVRLDDVYRFTFYTLQRTSLKTVFPAE